jgi:hypothetical protein
MEVLRNHGRRRDGAQRVVVRPVRGGRVIPRPANRTGRQREM